ncbi:MAG: hypothetical protein AAF916_10720 [Planctomycetota bacterium]
MRRTDQRAVIAKCWRSGLLVAGAMTLAGCEGQVVMVEGDTMTVAASDATRWVGIAAGLALLGLGALVFTQGQIAAKRTMGALIFVGFGVSLTLISFLRPTPFMKGDAERIVFSPPLLEREPRLIELQPLDHVSVHRAVRRRGNDSTRRPVDLLWIHRPDGTREEVEFFTAASKQLLDHVLDQLSDRGIRIEDFRDADDPD